MSRRRTTLHHTKRAQYNGGTLSTVDFQAHVLSGAILVRLCCCALGCSRAYRCIDRSEQPRKSAWFALLRSVTVHFPKTVNGLQVLREGNGVAGFLTQMLAAYVDDLRHLA